MEKNDPDVDEEIFEYRAVDYVVMKPTDDLIEGFLDRVEWLIYSIQANSQPSSERFAVSAYRYARELEHRGVRLLADGSNLLR